VITTAILVFLGALLAVVLFQMFKPGARTAAGGNTPGAGGSAARPAAPPAPTPAGANVDLVNARPGDVVSIPGAAADFSDVDFTIDRRSAYEYMSRRWTDLSGEFRGNRVYLEVQPGSEAQVMGILDPRRLLLPDVGTSEDGLADMDARQDQNAFVEFEGRRWQFEYSREIGYFENEVGDGEGLYRWLFRESGGNRVLIIEKWEGEPFDVRIGQRLNPRDVTVYRAA